MRRTRTAIGGLPIAAGCAALLAASGPVRASLVEDWKGDTYSTGASWIDAQGSVTASATGVPTAVAHAFGSHTGVQLSGTGQYFTVAGASNPLASQIPFTLAAVFKANANGAGGGNNFFQSSGLIGMEESGVAKDFGLGYGASSGTEAIGGVGDPTAQIPPGDGADHSVFSGPLAAGTHAAVLTMDASDVLTLFVDGSQIAQNTVSNYQVRNADSFALGAITAAGGNPFNGLIAELQIYSDAENGPALSQSLLTTYSVPEPPVLGLLLAGVLLSLRRRPRTGDNGWKREH